MKDIESTEVAYNKLIKYSKSKLLGKQQYITCNSYKVV